MPAHWDDQMLLDGEPVRICFIHEYSWHEKKVQVVCVVVVVVCAWRVANFFIERQVVRESREGTLCWVHVTGDRGPAYDQPPTKDQRVRLVVLHGQRTLTINHDTEITYYVCACV